MIRKIKKEDLPEAFEVLKNAWLDTYVELGIEKSLILSRFADKEGWVKNFESFLESENAVSYVSVDKEQISGLIFGRVGKIQALYVDVPFKSKGIGSALLDKFISHSLPVNLSVLEINIKAQDFYLKKDFKPTGEYTFFSIGDKKYKDLEFIKVR